MATVTIEPVAWQWRHPKWTGGGWEKTENPNRDTSGAEYRPLYTADALATAHAEGKAEGMRDAAGIAREAGNIANMLWNDNVDAERSLVRRDAAYKIQKRILAAIPAPQETLPSASPNREGKDA